MMPDNKAFSVASAAFVALLSIHMTDAMPIILLSMIAYLNLFLGLRR
jgi:hypothetical protein